MNTKVADVLANWLKQSESTLGQFPSETERARWVCENVLGWMQQRARFELDRILQEAAFLRRELNSQGGWGNEKLQEAMHALTHITDSAHDISALLGFDN